MQRNTLENFELRNEEVQNILSKVPHWMIRWGSILLLLIIILLLFLSYFIKYPDVIVSKAVITTNIPPQKEFAKVTGKIDTILISNQQKVYPNQPLAVIKNTGNFKDIQQLKNVTKISGLKNGTFQFPIDEIPILDLGEIEPTYAIFESSYIEYMLARELKPYSIEAKSNEISLRELKTQYRNLKIQENLNKSKLGIQKKDLERHRELYEKGVISATEYEIKQINYLDSERSLKNLSSSLSQLRISIGNAKNLVKTTAINRKMDQKLLLKKLINDFNQLKVSIKTWEHTYVMTAEIEGTISFLNYWSENQTVSQGDLLFTIIPSQTSSVIAKLKTPIKNSGKLKIGQKVYIGLHNYPEPEFGVLEGTINQISALPDKKSFYNIDVLIPQDLITNHNKKIDFKQEMAGTAEIITDDLKLIERIFYRIRGIFQN